MPRKKKVAGEEEGQPSPMATEEGAAASTSPQADAEEAEAEEEAAAGESVESPREETNKPPVTITRGIVCGTIAVSLQNQGDDAEGARPARSNTPGPARPLHLFCRNG